MNMASKSLLAGLALTLLSSFFGSLIGAGSKFVSPWMSIHVLIFCQFGLGLCFSLPGLAGAGSSLHLLRTQRLALHLIRGLAGIGSFYCFYLALRHVPLVDAALLRNTSPLCVPLLALVCFRKVIGWRGWVPLLIGFAGVLCILRPSGGISVWHLIGLGSGFLLAVSMITTRMLVATEPPSRVVFYYFFIALIVTLPGASLNWSPAPWYVWLAVVGVGVSITLAMNFYTVAFTYAKPSVLAPISYMGVVFAGLLGWLLWGEVPDLWTCVGVLLVVGGAIAVLLTAEADTPLLVSGREEEHSGRTQG